MFLQLMLDITRGTVPIIIVCPTWVLCLLLPILLNSKRVIPEPEDNVLVQGEDHTLQGDDPHQGGVHVDHGILYQI